jgi:hypothetical protein
VTVDTHIFFFGLRLTIFQIQNVPCKAYFGHVSLKSLLNAMYEFVTFTLFIFFAGVLGSLFNWIPETYDAYVALSICKQVEFIILCRANSILEHTGNFLMISMTL